jgi:hypothetical protein
MITGQILQPVELSAEVLSLGRLDVKRAAGHTEAEVRHGQRD